MEQWFLEFAGIRVCVSMPREHSPSGKGMLADFCVPEGSCDHTVTFRVVEELEKPRGERVFACHDKWIYCYGDTQLRYEGALSECLDGAFMCIARTQTQSEVQLLKRTIPVGITPNLVMSCLEAEHLLACRGGFLLHASVIRVADRAVLFTAPSGTGKSTQAELWRCHRGAELINGDRIAVMDGHVYGIPFCGSSAVAKNVKLPLAAIVYLSQAPENVITPLTGVRAFRKVWEGCSVNVWNREDMERVTQAVISTVSAVSVAHLACTPDERAVALLERYLKEEGAI